MSDEEQDDEPVLGSTDEDAAAKYLQSLQDLMGQALSGQTFNPQANPELLAGALPSGTSQTQFSQQELSKLLEAVGGATQSMFDTIKDSSDSEADVDWDEAIKMASNSEAGRDLQDALKMAELVSGKQPRSQPARFNIGMDGSIHTDSDMDSLDSDTGKYNI